MPSRISFGLRAILASYIVIALSGASTAQNLRVVHNFDQSTDGYHAYHTLIADSAGNLYGVTANGGSLGCGTAFKLTLQAGGGWGETILHSFGASNDGCFPYGPLTFDQAGDLYGTTERTVSGGVGTVFELTPTATGWNETVIYTFGSSGANDGAFPVGSVTLDSSGNVYGTTTMGGSADNGIVFELSPSGNGQWTENIIHTFTELAGGFDPMGGLIFDSSGNLYGVTLQGGPVGNGTVFELTNDGNGTWTKRIIHVFGVGDGAEPNAPLIFDAAGNLYGTTSMGGKATTCGDNGCGTVFELSPKNGGGWSEKILHNFSWNGTDGWSPFSGVTLDAAGNIYGTTESGGNGQSGEDCPNQGCGTVFALHKTSGGGWAEKILFSFSGTGTDTNIPAAGLVFGANGLLYGATVGGGANGNGTVFAVKP
jgi:uncharacterized repeat protein (TIGR03803 family)